MNTQLLEQVMTLKEKVIEVDDLIQQRRELRGEIKPLKSLITHSTFKDIKICFWRIVLLVSPAALSTDVILMFNFDLVLRILLLMLLVV